MDQLFRQLTIKGHWIKNITQQHEQLFDKAQADTNVYKCMRCMKTGSVREIKAWLKEDMRRTVNTAVQTTYKSAKVKMEHSQRQGRIHITHDVRRSHGMLWCFACGCHNNKKISKLKKPCEQKKHIMKQH